MSLSLRTLAAGLATSAALLLGACGGGGGGDGDAPPAAAPTAVAAADQSRVPIGTTVTLDGSGSSAPGGATLGYQWSLPIRPEGSTAVLSSASDARPSFTPDVAGLYEAELTVTTGQASAVTRVGITATTDVPTAIIADASQTVLLGSTVVLDGSASTSPTGEAGSGLSYQWQLAEQPAGDPVTVLNGATGTTASFTAQKTGTYRATLVVRHGSRSSAAAQAEIRVNTGNSAPMARASAPATVERGTTVVLDGSGSFDPDGDTLHYRWNFPPYSTSGVGASNVPPLANTATIRNSGSAVAEFTPDAVGNYDVILTVYDGSVAVSQKLTIAVTRPAGATNVPPVAVIGSGAAHHECEVGGYCGLSSYRSHDADGDARTYLWTYWNAATPSDRRTVAGSGLYAISTASAGTWHVELVANDGQADSATAAQTVVVKTGANVAPTTRVSVDAGTVLVGETIAFDGSATTDANGDQISYQWTLIDRPDGSNATLQNATSARATVVADRPGIYRARLVATDSAGAVAVFGPSNFGSAFAKARNNAPVVADLWLDTATTTRPAIAADQPLVIYSYVDTGANNAVRTGYRASIRASIFDPDLDAPLYYILTATRFPAGSAFTASVAGQANVGGELSIMDPATRSPFLLSLPGEYEFQLLVSDGAAYSEAKTLNFNVVTRGNYPGILLENVVGDGDASYPNQFLWPHNAYQQGFRLLANDDAEPRAFGYGSGVLRLYAADGDYTVTDLVTAATDSSLAPSFSGLSNGQVIRQGESVTFTLTRPAIPNERALVLGLMDIATQHGSGSDEYRNEEARLIRLYEDYSFTASFRIAEKPGRTFYVGPVR